MARPEAEVFVYAQRADRVSIAEIVSAMRGRGVELKWHPELLPEDADPRRWNAGYFTESGRDLPRYEITSEKLEQWARDEALETHATVLSPALRGQVESAQFRYRLSIEQSAPEGLRVLVNLVDAVADIAQGFVQDLTARRFYERDAYRVQHGRIPDRAD